MATVTQKRASVLLVEDEPDISDVAAEALAREIRSPLQTMKLLVYAIQQDCPPQSPLRMETDVLQQELDRLALLVEQCLEVAHPRSPTFTVQKLHDIMEDAFLIISAEAQKLEPASAKAP